MSYELKPVTLGTHKVTFAIERQKIVHRDTGETKVEPGALKITATSDTGGVSEGVLSMHPNHNHSEEQFLKDLGDFAQRLAEEAAGKAQRQNLIDKFFPEGATQ